MNRKNKREAKSLVRKSPVIRERLRCARLVAWHTVKHDVGPVIDWFAERLGDDRPDVVTQARKVFAPVEVSLVPLAAEVMAGYKVPPYPAEKLEELVSMEVDKSDGAE